MGERRPMVLEPLRRTASDAMRFAEIAHAGQKDKAGDSYLNHLARVVSRGSGMATDMSRGDGFRGRPARFVDEVEQVAWLHDSIEDHGYTVEDLLREGFSREVAWAVGMLSRRPDQASYMDFIRAVVSTQNALALLVKIADVEDNSDPARLALLPAETRARLEKKYGAALPVLKAAADRLGWKEERS